MGSSQREATVVAIGLVIVATLVVVYLFNEPNRRDVAAEEKVEESVERGVALYTQYCFQCHGEDGRAVGRQGIPLNTEQNQVEEAALWEQREPIIRRTIERGRGQIMPAWAESEGGPLNEDQVTDLVNLIHEGAWEEVTAEVKRENGGQIPTPPPPPTPATGGDPVELGEQIYNQQGCVSCHSLDGSPGAGPTWQGLFGSEVPLEGGQMVTADETYITESILNPQAKLHQGFGPIMPTYQGVLNEEQINGVIEFIKTLE